MIRGIGIDAVDVARFRAAMDKRGERFLARLFTPSEIEYCTHRKRPEEHLAARFAAKVSVFKATGVSFRFTDIEIRRSASGMPEVCFLSGRGIAGVHLFISMSHDAGLGIASAIAESR